MRFDERGREIPDNTPIEVPVQFRKPETIAEQVKRLVHSQLSIQAANAGRESFQEADDFDVDDDMELKSKYELDDEMVNVIQERPMTKEERSSEKKRSVSESGTKSSGEGGIPDKPGPRVSGQAEGADDDDKDNRTSDRRRN